jgi:RNA-binding protein 23/39
MASLPAQLTAAGVQPLTKLPPLVDANGKQIQAQKVYVGNLEASLVTAQHLQALFAPFGTLTEINLQAGKGFAFLQFHDPKEAALAIQTMAGQMLAGRPMKTGWATNQVSVHGIEVVTSHEFPPDAATRAENAYRVLALLTSGGAVPAAAAATQPTAYYYPVTTTAAALGGVSRVPTVAEARASLAAGTGAMGGGQQLAPTIPPVPAVVAAAPTVDPTKIGNADHPTPHVLVHNMFDKDEETEAGWEKEIREEFEEECSKYGKIVTVTVISKEPGGKIYASFDSTDGAKTCASSLAGRWFDKRQLRVEFVGDHEVQRVQKEYP